MNNYLHAANYINILSYKCQKMAHGAKSAHFRFQPTSVHFIIALQMFIGLVGRSQLT